MADLYPECAALCEHTNQAASEARNIWYGFLAYGAFLTVAVAGTTHRMMFLETPISLPILSIELDLVGFFITAPILLVVLHLYLVVKLVLLSESYATLEAQVERDIPLAADREQMRKHLNTSIFLQALRLWGRHHRVMKTLLLALLLVTIVIGPLAALLFTQIRFLPYQSEFVTSLHRLLLLSEVLTLAAGYDAVLRNRSLGRPLVSRRIVYPFAVVFVGLLWMAISFPSECWIDTPEKEALCFDGNPIARATLRSQYGAPELFVLSPVTLNLQNEDFVDDLQIDDLRKVVATQVRRSRSFVGAKFDGADLRKADFTDADMRGTSFFKALLGGATLSGSRLQGASFAFAELQGASLDRARLEGASFTVAQLQGASLRDVQAQGASFHSAFLQGASLANAELQGASFSGAVLQGASLDSTQLLGADLNEADLRGALLRNTQLQGASLAKAQLGGAKLVDVRVWRTTPPDRPGALIVRPITAPEYSPGIFSEDETLTNEVARIWIDAWLARIPQGQERRDAVRQLEVLVQNWSGKREDIVATRWLELAALFSNDSAQARSDEVFSQEFRHSILNYACDGSEDAATAIKSMLRWEIFTDTVLSSDRPGAVALANDLLGCPVAEYLDQKTEDSLRRIARMALNTSSQ